MITGRVTDANGAGLPGVTVDARSPILPGPRTTVTGSNGTYQLPALPPGEYTVTFTLSGMTAVTRNAQVQLGLDLVLDAKLSIQGVKETITVRAQAGVVDKQSSSITSGIGAAEIDALPVGQQYQDIIKLIPGVQYTQDSVRGPSAGASGQSNVYQFDGVNVTLPLFGTLSAEPASHDIQQVTVIKGGAKAIDFNRAAGFSIDSVSKSGTSQFTGLASYEFQTNGMSAGLVTHAVARYQQDRKWYNVAGGGPLVKDRLFFYGSYYRPEYGRANVSTAYGTVPNYRSTRDEGFGKLTLTPKSGVLINGSYRDSHTLDQGSAFGSLASATTGAGNESWLRIFTADASWVVNAKSFATFKLTHFGNLTQGRPDNTSNAVVNTALGTQLPVNALDTAGQLSVPAITASNTAFNAFVQPLIDTFGYTSTTTGLKTGGGTVGDFPQFNKQNFYRTSGQGAYNYTLQMGSVRHELHAGYQRYVETEDLLRTTNGWGTISVPGGVSTALTCKAQACTSGTAGQLIYYQAAFQVQGFGNVSPMIHSEYRSQNIEFNDTITHKNLTINIGMLDSNDQLWGQGLQADPTTLSGFALSTATTALGRRYMEYEIPWKKMVQPRVGLTWAYDGTNTLWMSYSKSNPAASSLPRAASWDRNLQATVTADFDRNGSLIAIEGLPSSSGKLFVPNMDPPRQREFMAGTSQKMSDSWALRLYGRVRKGDHFWEDTNNTARIAFAPPMGTVAPLLYISDLSARNAQIGGQVAGSSYVIAELDNAFTKYWEITAESEWRSRKTYVNVSYTRSHYYGNFDQDQTTVTTLNDGNIFFGSSNIGDGAGHQLWDNKLGTLHADRPNMFKAYGTYMLNWNASLGAYLIVQSGQAWEAWSYLPYAALTSSTSETIKFAEPAGSRRTHGHAQLDLTYSQSIQLDKNRRLQVSLDVFNVFNSQTGYNYDPRMHTGTAANINFGLPQSYYDPRRAQVTAKFLF
jgi:hypothetical protein